MRIGADRTESGAPAVRDTRPRMRGRESEELRDENWTNEHGHRQPCLARCANGHEDATPNR